MLSQNFTVRSYTFYKLDAIMSVTGTASGWISFGFGFSLNWMPLIFIYRLLEIHEKTITSVLNKSKIHAFGIALLKELKLFVKWMRKEKPYRPTTLLISARSNLKFKQEFLGRTNRILFFTVILTSDMTSRKKTSVCMRNEVTKAIQFRRLQFCCYWWNWFMRYTIEMASDAKTVSWRFVREFR
jgi:hypothetical protein